MGYPQTNKATEVTNRPILQGLKQSLDSRMGNWLEELPNFLWSYRTTPQRATRESPFNLCFRVKAIIPLEVGVKCLRNEAFNEDLNNQLMEEILLLLDIFEQKPHKGNYIIKDPLQNFTMQK